MKAVVFYFIFFFNLMKLECYLLMRGVVFLCYKLKIFWGSLAWDCSPQHLSMVRSWIAGSF